MYLDKAPSIRECRDPKESSVYKPAICSLEYNRKAFALENVVVEDPSTKYPRWFESSAGAAPGIFVHLPDLDCGILDHDFEVSLACLKGL